ncbi:MAG: hypothetical protein ACR2ND_08465 [Solirubrobacteraceae bacterium]
MDLLLAWVLYPVVLLALCVGVGCLLTERGSLMIPAGLAGICVIAGLATATSATAPAATALCALVALAGLAVRRPWRRYRPSPALALAALGVFAVFAAPVVLSGSATFAGYIKLDDTSTWLNITDHLLAHGRSTGDLHASSFQINLQYYLGTTGYPVGSFLPFGVARALSGQDAAWVFQPYLAFLAAALALALDALVAPLVVSPRWRAAAVFVAAQATLLYGYSLWGGVKELATAVLLATLAAAATEWVLLAFSGAALLAVLGPGALPWLGPLTLALAAVQRRALVRPVLAAALLTLPTWLIAKAFIEGGGPLYTNGAGLYNLTHPLSAFQLVGIWPSGDFRLYPHSMLLTDVLMAAALALAAYGLWAGRRSTLALYAIECLGGCVLIALTSVPWIAAKALASAAPLVLLAACTGAALLWQRGRRAAAIGGIGLLGFGVLWSNALGYHSVWLAPPPQLAELHALAPHAKGPTLVAEYDVYADRHFLRAADPTGAADYRTYTVPLRSGVTLTKEAYADLDAFYPATLLAYRSILTRRSPADSRPPAPFARVWSGRYFQLWQQPLHATERVLAHLPLGDAASHPFCGYASSGYSSACATQPANRPSCAQVAALQRNAPGGRLVGVPRAQPIVVPAGSLHGPRSWSTANGLLSPSGPGSASGAVQVPAAGRYRVWLGGSFGRAVELRIDGRAAGGARDELNNIGQFVELNVMQLSAGQHQLQFSVPAGDLLRPGSGARNDSLSSVVLAAPQDATSVVALTARQACGGSFDWIEVLAP